ncbi:hypothetical protein CEXT_478971 [Caerostris extrusa]|uniref:Uncharacterized protein n=1 Tax=Caerostris extrusa TaxID=172846 RepID=A0AAV4Y921_CAEEX|nr:hypothetical protein CEXT_478971 [Caerostris extrusa]
MKGPSALKCLTDDISVELFVFEPIPPCLSAMTVEPRFMSYGAPSPTVARGQIWKSMSAHISREDIRCLNIDHAEYDRHNPRDYSQELPASLHSSLDGHQMNPSQWHTDTTEDDVQCRI